MQLVFVNSSRRRIVIGVEFMRAGNVPGVRKIFAVKTKIPTKSFM